MNDDFEPKGITHSPVCESESLIIKQQLQWESPELGGPIVVRPQIWESPGFKVNVHLELSDVSLISPK